MRKQRNLDLLFELGCLRFIQRSWKRFLNPNFQNLTEHHYRVIWIALILAQHEGTVNTEKIMKMALIHDIGESRTGDCDYLSRQYVQRNEDLAMEDILKETALEKEFMSLWKEYTERTTLEAKIVKDADTLDVDIELKEQESAGHPIRGKWLEQRKRIAENKLYTQAALELWRELQNANPHNWHMSGRTRFSESGDWKDIK